MTRYTRQLANHNIGLDNVTLGHYADQATVVHKFGRNDAVGTTLVPITQSGIYRTPQVVNATAVRIKAGGSADDAAGGSGAREITIQGLDQTGAEVVETVATAGAVASAPTTTTWLRIYRAFVSASGSYANETAGSHAAAITIENAAGTEDWFLIAAVPFPLAQTEIGVYTVPLGKVALVREMSIQIESNKVPSVLFFQRRNILETAPPYSAMRVVNFFAGLSDAFTLDTTSPLGPFPELTDIGFMGVFDAGSGSISVDFEILVTEKE